MTATAPTNKPTVVRRVKNPCLRCRQPTSFIQTVGRNHVWACPTGHVNLVTPLTGL